MENEGKKFDEDKIRLDLIPVLPLQGWAKILTFGSKKYGDRNWESGIKYSRVFGALMRHILAWWGGEDNDPETGENHLYHAMCCLGFLACF